MAFSNALVLCFFLAITMPLPTLATNHIVGDGLGWTVGPDYNTWTSDKTFAVGDSLVFNYVAGHTVDEVKESDYKSCTTGNSISTDSSGATTIPLKEAGTHYFICAIPGHCTFGMKLFVKVKPSSAAPSATPLPSGKGSPSDRTPAATTTTTTPTIQSASSATTISPTVAFFFTVSWILIHHILV
ncbi:putative Blue (type 1) copper binding protein [Medicago truncatula]|uniref:Blue copper-like protein n=1 Tax=Medicago truncatula TaxID=3880 RepID=G7J401_MEDTR|nr:blue copper protein [Medicago truncatula]AES73096.1 blue copper-like protein [Medicago truncatula]RHN70145.1 putative Blue (type 1) copper binding protein [Medicago truncatula]